MNRIAHAIALAMGAAVVLAECAMPVQPANVSVSQARAVVERFVGTPVTVSLGTAHFDTHHPSSLLSPCYHFTVCRGASSSAQRLLASAWVEHATGRVLYYATESKYRGAAKPLPSKDRMVRSRAIQAAKDILKRAGVGVAGKRVESVDLSAHSLPEERYSVRFVKHAVLPGIGEVELPVRATVQINALTGEPLSFFLYERPLRIKLLPPRIDEKRAIAIARKAVPSVQQDLYGRYTSADAHLVVDAPNPGRPQSMYWEVTLQRSGGSRGDTAFVDTENGSVVGIAAIEGL